LTVRGTPPVALALAASLSLVAGCTEPSEAIWLEGAGFAWVAFNHRLSYVEIGVDDDVVRAGVIGGTSTTNEEPELPDGCDPDTCAELPLWDDALIGARLVHVSSSTATLARGRGSLIAGAAGGETTVTVELPGKGKGTVTAVIAGLTLDADTPLSGGEACYTPRYGWHPRRIAVVLGDPVLAGDGRSVDVPVSAWFEAGESLEEMRECLDAVNDQAQLAVAVDLVVIVGADEAESIEVAHGLSYPYGDGPMNPDEQPPPDPAERPLGTSLQDPVLGWSALDFRFHDPDPDDRGAYLRSWTFDARLAGDVASGHATNYSPVSQLSGFEYTFAGTVEALVIDGDVARGLVRERLIVELDDDARPVVVELPVSLDGDGGPELIEMPF